MRELIEFQTSAMQVYGEILGYQRHKSINLVDVHQQVLEYVNEMKDILQYSQNQIQELNKKLKNNTL